MSLQDGDVVLTYSLGVGYYLTLGSFVLVFPEAVENAYKSLVTKGIEAGEEVVSEHPSSIDLEREIAIEKAELDMIQLEKRKPAKRRN